MPSIDRERYTEIPGLEGPFSTESGKVLYYDPKEGRYYDRDTDMYLSHEEYDAYNKRSMGEAAVADIGAARDKRDVRRKFDDRQDQRMKGEQQKSAYFGQLDHAVAAAIDTLVSKHGMDHMAATDAVMKHLSDTVMAHDI